MGLALIDLVLLLLVLWVTRRPTPTPARVLEVNGRIEGDPATVGAKIRGKVVRLAVGEGDRIGDALRSADRVWVAVALGLVLIGYGFEITLVPLHFWAPDTYQGSTAPIAGFLSVVPKIAGFAGLLRFAMLALPGGLMQWPTLVAILAAGTMTFGNLVALRQVRLKRLLAYSSIAQAGYVLMAVDVADRIETALGGAVNMAIALYYYVAIVAAIYLHTPPDEEPVCVGGIGSLLAASLSLAGTFILGILPGPGLTLTQLIGNLA
jgi:NADH-quinone oxidoreductase subunit N